MKVNHAASVVKNIKRMGLKTFIIHCMEKTDATFRSKELY